MSAVVLWVQDAALKAPQFVWPTTVAGWIALIGFAFLVFDRVVARVRWTEQVNGLGSRMNDVEKNQKEQQGQQRELHEAVKGTLAAQAALMEKIGEARKGAADCDERTTEMGIMLGSKLDEMRTSFAAWERRLADRMLSLETELSTRRIIGPRGGQPKEDNE